jgi:uncharacterized membrane protein
MNFCNFLKRLSNKGTIVGVASVVVIMLPQFGIAVDNEKIMYVVNGFCTIGILLGFLNNSTTEGIDNPFK